MGWKQGEAIHHPPPPSSLFTVPTMATTETKPAAKDDAAPLLDVLEEDDEFEVRGWMMSEMRLEW